MISAYAVAHRATGRKSDLEAARKAAGFALDSLRDGSGQVRVSWRRGRAGGPGFLDDNAFLARGLLDLHATDGDARWLKAAAEVVRDAGRFADVSNGGYFFAAERSDLLARPLSLEDSALPSGNAVMAENLARLSHLTGDLGHLRAASAILARGAGRMRSDPRSHAYLIMARDTVRVASAAARRPGEPPPAVAASEQTAAEAAAQAPPAAAPRESGAAPTPAAETGAVDATTLVDGRIVGRANRERVVTSRARAPRGPARPGEAVALEIQAEIKTGWHVNSSQPTLEYLIPTKISLADGSSAKLQSIDYPEGHLVKLKFAEDQLSVYEGRIAIPSRLVLPRDAPAGSVQVPVRLTYQACSDKACLPPETAEFLLAIAVEGEPLAESAAPPPDGGQGAGAVASLGRVEGQDQLSVLLRTRGLLFVAGVVLLGGLALTLTPCVYPMIPVTIGFFANQSADAGWGRRLALPSLYVLGLALTYSVLGVVAGTSGSLFGATLQSPILVGAMILLFVAMALWMFGVYELRLPGWMMQVGAGRSGALGAFVMGLTLGLVAAPCIGPFIVTLLAFVGASGSGFLGFLLFFVLAIGMGLPFLVLGAFSGMLSSLPRSGVWLIYAKKVMGVGLLAVALYFLQPFLSDKVLGYAALGFAALAGLYLAWFEKTRMKGRFWIPLRLATGALVVLVGLYLALPLVRAREEAPWRPYSEATFEEARAAGRPILIDFFAVWCAPCRELDRHTYSDPRVLKEMERFTLLKADLTDEESPLVGALRERYEVFGVPTVVFIDRQGGDRKDLRLTGFEPPDPFLERLRQVL
jgi:thiol:disulfide interchange protein DsbD